MGGGVATPATHPLDPPMGHVIKFGDIMVYV